MPKRKPKPERELSEVDAAFDALFRRVSGDADFTFEVDPEAIVISWTVEFNTLPGVTTRVKRSIASPRALGLTAALLAASRGARRDKSEPARRDGVMNRVPKGNRKPAPMEASDGEQS